MDIAVLFSGGKDSVVAVELALSKGWNVKYLLSIKPNRTDCYLFHYATIELTKEVAEILGIKHIYRECKVADPLKEAEIVRKVVEKNKVDALVLGGTGLQETQLKVLQEVLLPLGVEVFPSHGEYDHDDLLREMVNKGYKIMITQIASDGLNKNWLGKILTKDNIEEFFIMSKKYGFPAGGDGGYYDTLVLNCPLFKYKKIEISDFDKIMENDNTGHIKVNKFKILKIKDGIKSINT